MDNWPKIYCKDGLLVVNIICCIPINSETMTENPFYDAWFTYTSKISECFGKININIPVLVMCNNSLSTNLVKYMFKFNSKAKKLQHLEYISYSVDMEKT